MLLLTAFAAADGASVTLTNCTFDYTAEEFKNSNFKFGVKKLEVEWSDDGKSATTKYNASKEWEKQTVPSST